MKGGIVMNKLMTFKNSAFGTVRTTMIDDEPWFVGKDVASALGFSNSRDAIRTHVFEDDKGVDLIDTLGGIQEMTIINESGLYALIFGSRLASARKFKRWVTSEVLPTLRKTGQYSTNQNEYMKIAQMVVKCPNKRLPVLLKVLRKAGFDFDEPVPVKEKEPDVELVELLNRFPIRYLEDILHLPKSTIHYYRTGTYKPQPERRRYIIETLTR